MVEQVSVVCPKGRLDSATSPAFEQDLMKRIAEGHALMVLDLSGLTFISSAGLRTILLLAKQMKSLGGRLARAVVVDLSNVNLLTSLGIRVLLLGARAVKNKGDKLVILSPDANVRAVLTTARTDTLIPIFDDRSAAIAAVSASAG